MDGANVALVLPSLVGGGAERVGCELANHWVQQGHAVTLITIDHIPLRGFELDSRVRRVGLGLSRQSRSFVSKLRSNIQRVRKLRQAIRDSSATTVVSMIDITNVTTLMACRPLDAHVIVCERTDPRQHHVGRVWSWLRRKTYPTADAVVVQTRGVGEWVKSKGWNAAVCVIPNAAPDWKRPPERGPEPEVPNCVAAAGRLSPEKGFDALIRAFGIVAQRHPDWKLVIHGEGRQRKSLHSLVNQLRLEDRVTMPGWNDNVEAALGQADIFVLPSKYEGFPNALLQAMAIGVASVSFDCPSGPSEIIRDGVDGLLVPAGDEPALAAALDRLMADPALRQRLGQRAQDVKSRFARDTIYAWWDALLDRRVPAEIEIR